MGASSLCQPAYGLVCPFLNDDPVYAYGVELGLLYARMNDSDGVIEDYFCRANQDQILLLAEPVTVVRCNHEGMGAGLDLVAIREGRARSD